MGGSSRVRSLVDALCARFSACCPMASSNAFASALAESPACKSHFFASSSPDLPTIDELLRRDERGLEPPPFKAPSKVPSRTAERPAAVVAPQSLSAAIQSRAGVQVPHEDENTAIEVEDISLVEIEAETFLKSKKSRGKEAPPRPTTTSRQTLASIDGQQPWRKFKTKGDINVQGQIGKQQDDGGEASLARPDTHGEPFQVSNRPKRHGQDASFNLEPAMTRRLDWTPPETTTPITIDSTSPASRQLLAPEEPSTKAQEFEQLLQSYKCAHKMRQDVPTVSDDDCNFLKKRKLVEMVATTNGPAQVVEKMAEKPKAAKKKPRTITELATAAYRPEIASESASTTTATESELPQSENIGEGSKKGRKAPEKRTKRVVRKKTTSQPASVLLPPEEALREVANQDFVFGTSSQLAVEKSPTFLRYLQAAMKESNETSVIDLEGWRSSNTVEAPRTQRRLWNAGARDEDGELFDVELSNMANGLLPDMSASQEMDDPFGYLQDGRKPPAIHPDKLPETADDDLPVFGSKEARKPITQAGSLAGMDVAASKHEEAAATDDHLVDAPIPQRPSYDSYTDAKLAREVKSYGFKPIKSRTASIALLEKCWASKVCSSISHTGVGSGSSAGFASKAGQTNNTKKPKEPKEPVTPEAKRRRGRPRKDKDTRVGAVDPHEPPPSAQPRESPARPRGRPRKTATAPAAPLADVKPKRGRPPKKPLEIPDSASEGESDASVKPKPKPKAKSPRRKKSPTRKSASPSPPPVDFSSADEAGSSPESSSQLQRTFSLVTKAVKSAPRSQDPQNPSWHEKMLMYDPIILEDLTDWLNGGELSRVGCGEEVSVGEVKKWCEGRSVCCLKRENLRGKERKRC